MLWIAPVRKNTALTHDICLKEWIDAGDLGDLMRDISGGRHWNDQDIEGNGTDGR